LADGYAMDRDAALRFVSHLIEKKVFHLSIAGGEPLLYPHLVEVIRAASEGGLLVALSTNASLLTEKLANDLFEAGLRSMQISLDGSRAEINDSIRGAGRFSKTVSGLKIAINRGFAIYLAIVILKQNIDDLDSYFQFALKAGVRGVKVQTLIDSGLGHMNFAEIAVPPEILREALIRLWRLKKEYRRRLEIMLPLIPEVLHEAQDEPEYYNRTSSCLGCQPGLSTVRVNSHGDVRACGGMVDAPSVGNVKVTPLQEIWRQSADLVKWRNAAELSAGQSATSCGSICGKGCRSASAPAFAKESVESTARHYEHSAGVSHALAR
jgi:MoaA/NifB/PqqE/SkfB family radical SAM enzyme